jgi:tRNA (guanine-N7-)-methyltransferase
MRKKPNLLPRMERASAVLVTEPERFRGAWLTQFPGHGALHLELGCGKGRFTAETAAAEPEALLVAVEKVPDAMVVAMERAVEKGLHNVKFIDRDAALLPELFAPGEVERIYLNFCDPWPKSRDAKHRLTAPGFLRLYADVLAPGGTLRFKTDNLPLFEWSLAQFEAEGWALSEVTNDLHADGVCGVMTDYEAKFHAQGVKINRLVATKTERTKTTAAGVPERLRNAALSDAKGKQEKEKCD